MIELIASCSLWSVLITLAFYELARFLMKQTGLPVFNPVLVGSVGIIAFLVITKIPVENYQAGIKSISWLMTPATVCLAIPLYRQVSRLKDNLPAIIVGIASGAIVNLLFIGGMGLLLKFDREIIIGLLPKSITAAVATPLAELAGGLVPLTTMAVIITGVFGCIVGPFMCRVFRITDPIARGVSFGTASHVIGTTKAAEMSELSGAVGSLSLVVAALLTAVLLPLSVMLFFP